MLPTVQQLDVPGYDAVYRLDCAGATAFVALHALLAGRAFGGIRVRRYRAEREALDDALRLARAMSRKIVMAGIEAGGGKTVLVAPEGDRAAALERLGAFIESLGGRYHAGPDLGFTDEDEAALRRSTRHLACTRGLGEATARGVLHAVDAVASPRRVAVQGLGGVGLPLARMLQERGVEVVASDVRPVAGFDLVDPEGIYDVEADVFAPCAAGEVLDRETIGRLRCRVVCGAANNPLATEEDAERLHARGVLYVPDFLATGGAVIVGASAALGEADRAQARLAGIGQRVRDVVDRARREGRSPQAVAVEEADRRIARLRAQST